MAVLFLVQQSLSEVFERAMQAEGLHVREVVVECILLDAGATEGDQVQQVALVVTANRLHLDHLHDLRLGSYNAVGSYKAAMSHTDLYPYAIVYRYLALATYLGDQPRVIEVVEGVGARRRLPEAAAQRWPQQQ